METPGQRYDPVGSTNECDSMLEEHAEHEYFKDLENEQELLSTSLQALTSHFAQVQFRLRQIISAPNEERISLIEDLDKFASRGIPELKNYDNEKECMLLAIHQQRSNQLKLIKKLRTELKAASRFANQKGMEYPENDMESSEVLVNDDDTFDDTTNVDLSRLKTQILDLDTFVTDLQYETINLQQMTQAIVGYRNCEKIYRMYNINVSNVDSLHQSFYDEDDCALSDLPENYSPISSYKDAEPLRSDKSVKYSPKLFESHKSTKAITPGGKATNKPSSPKNDHWGNISIKLEIDVRSIIAMISAIPKKRCQQSDDMTSLAQKEIVRIVRKELCGTLRELIEHGLHSVQYSTQFISCCLRRSYKQIPSSDIRCSDRHAWDIILEYYNLNDGDQFYRKPINKLRESFQLKQACNIMTSTKQQLLKGIGDIMNIYFRSNVNQCQNSYFKAFVLLSLNLKMLPQWLELIFNCSDLVDVNYSDESFVRQPAFVEALNCLELLSNFDFNLPIDTLSYGDFSNNLFG